VLLKVVELSELLAAERDPVKCNKILRSWVERTLAEITGRDELWGAPLENHVTGA
jgi:hypothetical protein